MAGTQCARLHSGYQHLPERQAAFRSFVNDTLQKAMDNGDWKKAYEATLGKSGNAAPAPPTIERY